MNRRGETRWFRSTSRWVPCAVIMVLLASVFWPVIAGRQTFFGVLPGTLSPPPPASPPFLIDPQDSAWQGYPWARLVRGAWRAGRPPAWTPRTGLGESLVAPTIGSATSPLRWWAAAADPTPRRWDLYLLVRLWLTGVFAWGWAASLGLPFVGALVTAAGWVFSGHVVRNLNQAFLDADVWLPAVAWAAASFARRPSARSWLALAAGGGAVMLAGNPQPALLTGVFAAALLVAGAGKAPTARAAFPARVGLAVLAGVVALWLAAPFLLPFAEGWKRMQQVHDGQGTAYEPLSGAVSLLAPWLLGRFGEPWLGLNPNHFLAWLGVSVVVLAVLGVRAAWRGPSGPVVVVAPVLLLAAAFGIPPVSWLLGLPVLSLVWWSKYQGVTALCASTLAGYGAARLAARKSGRSPWRLVAPAAVVLELVWLMPRARPVPFDPLRPGPAVAWLVAHADPREERAWALGRTPMPQPLASAGVADARTYYGLYSRRAYWWMRGLVTGPAAAANDAVFTGSDHPLAKSAGEALSALAVRWVVSLRPVASPPAGWVRRHASDLIVYENTRVLPRAWVAERAVAAPSPEAALWAVSGDPANRRIAVVEGPPDWIGFRVRSKPSAARVLFDAGDRVAVEVPGEGPRVLVLMDTWEPGWNAFAGATRLRVLPANCAFRAVAVPPGESRVDFRYDPLPLKAGVRLFGVALGILLGVAGLAWGGGGPRSRRRR